MRGWLAPAGGFLAGCLSFTAFAGFDVWPLAFIALVPLYLSLIGQTPKRATWIGLCSGFAMCMGGFYWLANMLRTFSGFGLPLCLFFTSFICVYQGGRIALTGWLFGRFFGKAEDESQWEPIDEHAAPAIATAEAVSKPAPPRMAAE